MRLLVGCGGGRGVGAPTGLLRGRVVLRSVLFVPEAARAAILANRVQIEAAGPGHRVNADGSQVQWADNIAAGWVIKLGNQTAFVDGTGFFTIDATAAAATQGTICSPHDTASSYLTFSTSQLVTVDRVPTTVLIVEAAVQGPCCMTLGQTVNGCNTCPPPAAQRTLPAKRQVPLLGTPTYTDGPIGTVPTFRDGLRCGQLDGIQLGTNTGFEALVSYFGST